MFDTIVADQQRHQAVIDTLGTQLKAQLGNALKNGSAVSMVMGGASGLRSGLMENGAQLAIGMAAAHAAQPPPQHRPPEERKKGMAQYSADAYPEGAPLRDEQHAWLTGVRAAPEYVQAKAAVAAVSDAKRARAAGHYPDAQDAIQRAQATKFGGSPLVLNEAARLHDDMGDTAGAERLFDQANASADQTVDGYVDHVRMLFRVQQNDRAMSRRPGRHRQVRQRRQAVHRAADRHRAAVGRPERGRRVLRTVRQLPEPGADQGLQPGGRQEGRRERAGLVPVAPVHALPPVRHSPLPVGPPGKTEPRRVRRPPRGPPAPGPRPA